jgi:hypothetical protein
MGTKIDDDDVSAELAGQSLNPADFEGGLWIRFRIAGVDKKTFEAKNGKPADTRRVLVLDPGGKQMSLNKRISGSWRMVRVQDPRLAREGGGGLPGRIGVLRWAVGGRLAAAQALLAATTDDEEEAVPF